MSLTGFHFLWDKILSQHLQAVADKGCHLEGLSPYKVTAYRGYTVLLYYCTVLSLLLFLLFLLLLLIISLEAGMDSAAFCCHY
jgi:hypothetical protein